MKTYEIDAAIVRCKFCGLQNRLVRAHIIPESFFREQRGKSPTLLMVGGAEAFTKRAPIGVYDAQLLCAECESKFGDLDSYAAQILIEKFDDLFSPMQLNGIVAGYESKFIDQERLLRFLVSLLWRASASSESFYRAVELGPFEADAMHAVNRPLEPISTVFGAVLSRWTPPSDLGIDTHGIMDPFFERWGGVNAYRFSLGKTMAYVRVDKREFPPNLRSQSLCANEVLRLPVRNFSASKDFSAMRNTVKLNHQNHLNFVPAPLRRTEGER